MDDKPSLLDDRSWMMDDLTKARVTGSAFLAGTFVSWEKMTWKKAGVTGSAFLAGALVLWENMS